MQCESCKRVPLFEYRVVEPDGEDYLFCSWRCIGEYAELAALDDQRLAEDVRRHVESLPSDEVSQESGE